ncbi:MAG: thioredoxin family protein [Gammaproteobacteria bacterium]|nr:thioredoxin family protein [Gammaproteobacteria bacterium]
MIPKHTTLPVSLFLLTTMLLAGCSGSDDSETPGGAEIDSSNQPAVGEIQWFEGSIDEAFATAKRQDKPIFLYWGADWCPPCNQIQATIFNRQKFVVKSSLFVPVYLDGDTANAQRVGEEFGVMGYPTMILFSPQGEEVTRIPGGIDIQRYINVLDLAMSKIEPVARIVHRLSIRGAPLRRKEFRLLAYYSWEQDNERVLTRFNKLELFEILSSTCPPTLVEACSRIDSEYLTTIADAMTDVEKPFVPNDDLKNVALKKLRAVLQNKKLVRANLEFVLHSSADMARAFTDSQSPRRASLLGLWGQALKVVAADPQISVMERLYTSRGRIRMARIDDPDKPLSPEFQKRIADHVDWADQRAITSYERQAVINAAWNILSEAGMDEKATELLTLEIEKSHSPFYFMLDLAELAARAGKTDEAVDWLRRAYDESSGSATRFQWGYNYLVGLLELVPTKTSLIENEAIRVFDELDGQGNAFYQRTKDRLGRLDGRFREWNADGKYNKSIRLIRTKMQSICSSIPETDESRMTCDSFLAEA